MDLVGRVVSKKFRGSGVLTGVIESFDPSTGFFKIAYGDGNFEELNLSEATSLVQLAPEKEKVAKKRGRKPKKRRRIQDDPGKGFDNSVDTRVQSSDDSAAEFGLGRNLYDIMSVNGDLNKVVQLNGGLDLNLNEGFSLDAGSFVNVSSQQNACFRASIDLNLSAVNDAYEAVGSGDNGGQVEKKEREFDLNLVFDDENVELETEHGKQLLDVPTEMAESEDLSSQGAVKKIDAGSADLNADVDEVVSVQCLGGDQDEKESVRGNTSDVTDATNVNSNTSKFQSNTEVATPVACENETRDRRKRRKLISSLYSPEKVSLRRSARRAKALAFAQNIEPSTEVMCAATDVSSPGMSVVSEEKPDLPDSEGAEESNALPPPPQVELPPPSRNLNLEEIPVLDLFSVYACLRSFSNLLYLSPFRLEDFVSALKSKGANTLLDSIHVAILQSLRKQLEFLSNDGSEPASICLRNLNWDLLGVVTWPIFLAEYLLTYYVSQQKPSFSIGRLKLVDGDYYKQPAALKMEILQCLCDDVMEVECIRTELNRRTSASDFGADFDKNFNNGNFRKTRASLDSLENTLSGEDAVAAADTNDWNSDECCLCKMEGNLICCDGCPAAYHSRCVGVASNLLPEGEWFCPECVSSGHSAEMKPQKLIRGAELLGADPYGRRFFYCCGYLLVSESCDAESSFSYYQKDDISAVIHSLESSGFSYGSITRAISKCFTVHAVRDPSVLIVPSLCKPTEQSMLSNDVALKAEEGNERKLEVLGNQVMSSEGSAEVLQGLGAKRKRGRPPGSCRKSSAAKAKDAELSFVQVDAPYVNHYSFSCVASSIAEEIAHKPSGKANETLIKSEEEIVSTQLKIISKKSMKFYWPSVQNICVEMQKEKCGWCYCCKSLDEEKDCLFNVNTISSISEDLRAELDVLQSKQNKKGHLLDVTCYILSIERRLRGLLLGPWIRPDDSQLFLRNVLKASDFASVKHRLLLLESNLRPSALSVDWGKHVDLAVTMGSASHVVINTRASSKYGIGGRRRNRFGGFDPTPVCANGGLVMLWWRGGQASRKLYNWKVLPQSLASKVARKGGCMKIPGLLYPDSSELVKRSKQITWRAAVEMSTSVAQLALQVRELDFNIRWDEIENTHILSSLNKESQKSIKLFKKVVVRRKCVEGAVVKYLLDFGRRRLIPDVVQKHGSKLDDPTSERKKYWLEESYLPLHLLRNFEEKRIARKAGKVTSSKVLHGDKALKKPFKKKGFEYLFARAESSNCYHCGHCKKDVPISDAVSCHFCKEYFHKRHARKSAVAIGKKCTYTCHKCHSEKRKPIIKKKGKVKLQKVQYKNGIKSGNLTGKMKSKRGRKPKAYHTQKLLEKNKKIQVPEKPPPPSTESNVNPGVTLRRSARRAKCAPVQYNEVDEGGKSEKQRKSRNETVRKSSKEPSFQKKRTRPPSSFWKNGLQLSRKQDDGRAAEFKKRKLLIHSESSAEVADQPKCKLCGEEGYTPALKYISCESCGDWYHGDAFGLDAELIESIIGFKCHVCLKRSPPACPYVEDAIRLGCLKDQAASNEGMVSQSSQGVILDPKDTNVIENCATDVDDKKEPVQVKENAYKQASIVESESRMENGHLSDEPDANVEGLKGTEYVGEDLSNSLSEVACEPLQPDVGVKEGKDTYISGASLKDPEDTSKGLEEDLSNPVVKLECKPIKSDMGVQDPKDVGMSDLGELTTILEVESKPVNCDMDLMLATDGEMSDLTSVLDVRGQSDKSDGDVKDVTEMSELTSLADVGCGTKRYSLDLEALEDANIPNVVELVSLDQVKRRTDAEAMEEDADKS